MIKEIAFKAFVEIKDDKMVLNSEEFSINRTEWGIHYLSKSIFGGLKDNFIGDEVKIKLQIEASADF
ncbi:MAG: YceI family protein [Chitinophagia bacterium]|nr:YceI family protein [Chitinophagia bacterium]